MEDGSYLESRVAGVRLIHLVLSAELQDAYETKEEEAEEQTALKMSLESELINTSELQVLLRWSHDYHMMWYMYLPYSHFIHAPLHFSLVFYVPSPLTQHTPSLCIILPTCACVDTHTLQFIVLHTHTSHITHTHHTLCFLLMQCMSHTR